MPKLALVGISPGKSLYTAPMKTKLVRGAAALMLALLGGTIGYTARGDTIAPPAPSIPAQTVEAPAKGTTRLVYSLDKKQTDKEIIALINAAQSYIYFAIYTFTIENIADALIAAKRRGVAVYGVVDSGQAATSYSAPVIKKLIGAGIPVVSERHASGSGIMHIKALVTEKAYVAGSYNWTNSATTINDEIVEIGTDDALRQAYENILKKIFEAYKNNPAPTSVGAASVLTGTYDFGEAAAHVGEYAAVRGKLVKVHTSSKGTVFLDFCKNYRTCPFSGVIFADNAKKFGDLSEYEGKEVTLTGKVQLYDGRAEIVLKNPSQLSKN